MLNILTMSNISAMVMTYMHWRWDQRRCIAIRRRRKTLLLPFELSDKLIELALQSRNINIRP